MNVITIDNIKQVRPGDKFYTKGSDIGFKVLKVKDNHVINLCVNSRCYLQVPFLIHSETQGYGVWAHDVTFDHAERTAYTWPNPDDGKTHYYVGKDDRVYVVSPRPDGSNADWMEVGTFRYASRADMAVNHADSLPLVEYKLVKD